MENHFTAEVAETAEKIKFIRRDWPPPGYFTRRIGIVFSAFIRVIRGDEFALLYALGDLGGEMVFAAKKLLHLLLQLRQQVQRFKRSHAVQIGLADFIEHRLRERGENR